jgi:hypothetical protein
MIDKSSFSVEFLPLNYFIEILTDLESSNQGNSVFCSQGFTLSIPFSVVGTVFFPRYSSLTGMSLLQLIFVSNIQL